MLTCTCRTQSSLCSSVIYEVMSMMIEQRRDLNVSLCVWSCCSLPLVLCSLLRRCRSLWLSSGLIWQGYLGYADEQEVHAWRRFQFLDNAGLHRRVSAEDNNDSLSVLFTGCRSSIYDSSSSFFVVCYWQYYSLKTEARLHCEQFTVRFRLLTCEAAAFVTVNLIN